LEEKTVDWRYAVRGHRAVPRDVAVVGIDDVTFKDLRLGWPFPRSYHGRVVDRLRKTGAKVIAYDIEFADPTTPHEDNALIHAVGRAQGKVVLATTKIGTTGQTNIFSGELTALHARAGSAQLPLDQDGVIRHIDYAELDLKNFALVAAERATRRTFSQRDLGRGAWIDFAGPPGTVRAISFSRVLQGRFNPQLVRDKIVVVGATASFLRDVHTTPIGKMSGPEIEANAIETAVRGFPLKSAPKSLDVTLVILFGLLLPVAAIRWSPLLALGLSLGAVAVLSVVAQIAFDRGMIVTFVYPAAALVFSSLGALAIIELRLRPLARRRRE
jgi:CHASE2 domain-containing sensor protein